MASLMLVAAIVLVRSLVNFLDDWNEFPKSVVSAIDGIFVVIILLDIAHTVFGHLRASVFPGSTVPHYRNLGRRARHPEFLGPPRAERHSFRPSTSATR